MMSYGVVRLHEIFSVASFFSSILVCIFYFLTAKRTKTFMLSRSLTQDEIFRIITSIPSHVFYHKVKRIIPYGSNSLHLDCTTVKIVLAHNITEVKCTYRLNRLINLIFTLAFGLFAIGGVASLFDGDVGTFIIGIAIAVGIHFIRGKVLNRGRNIVVSIEEYLR